MSLSSFRWKALLVGIALALFGDLVGDMVFYRLFPLVKESELLVQVSLAVCFMVPFLITGFATGVFSDGAEIINSALVGIFCCVPGIAVIIAMFMKGTNFATGQLASSFTSGALTIALVMFGGWLSRLWNQRTPPVEAA